MVLKTIHTAFASEAAPLDVLYKNRTGMRDDRYGYTMPLKQS
ncbi:MAG: hypothetical protein WC568_11480 [Candidatus Methanoperedens sp.]